MNKDTFSKDYITLRVHPKICCIHHLFSCSGKTINTDRNQKKLVKGNSQKYEIITNHRSINFFEQIN